MSDTLAVTSNASSNAVSPMAEEGRRRAPFQEILVIMDDQTWIWHFISTQLTAMGLDFVRLPSAMGIRPGWNRFRNASRIIVHWENTGRAGGAIVEEIEEIDNHFDAGEKLIILTTNPTHEDVVYFGELSLRRILRLRQREKDLDISADELRHHLTSPAEKRPSEAAWRKILAAIDRMRPGAGSPGIVEHVAKIERAVSRLADAGDAGTARCLEARASLAALRGDHSSAESLWRLALDKNPNYYRACNNLIEWLREQGRLHESLAMMKRMQALNGANISRMAAIGEIHVAQGDDERGEKAFQGALERDAYCSRALNGLAEIQFRKGDLDVSRKLLAKSSLAYKVAKKLNQRGIDLVRKEKYEDALDHYLKAQYVLPQQDKGPMLFFNMALCYFRWGKTKAAREFVQIALIKDPRYVKAKRLLELIDSKA